ncbi:MAG: hypothetical protein UZ22_OP11002000740 [Microgenomates bacterium OLB23]|nr:MAG: hypothetical protein UZ22_OP11002000740 [Microgenomates bacterium OLB23]
MNNKPIIVASLLVLVVLLVVSLVTVNRPQQAGIKAQSLGDSQQCQNDGGFVTSQASCVGDGTQIISIIDAATAQVCCKTTIINTPVPPKSCPGGSEAKPEAECDPGQIVPPDNVSTATNEDNYVSPGVVCCRIASPTTPPSDSPSSTPPPSSCIEPEIAISISNVEVICPDGCTNTTQ